MNIQDIIDELLRVLDEIERQPTSEPHLRRTLNGLNFEIENLTDEIGKRGQSISGLRVNREIAKHKIRRLVRQTRVPETLEPAELAAERTKKEFLTGIKELQSDLDFYTSQLEIEMSRFLERQRHLKTKKLQKEKLETQIASLQTSPVVAHLMEALEKAFEKAIEGVSETLPANESTLFQTWCRRNGFNAASEMSTRGIAANWKRARISAGRVEVERQPHSASNHEAADDTWVMKAAFKNSLSW